jgi:hypothetical protein
MVKKKLLDPAARGREGRQSPAPYDDSGRAPAQRKEGDSGPVEEDDGPGTPGSRPDGRAGPMGAVEEEERWVNKTEMIQFRLLPK